MIQNISTINGDLNSNGIHRARLISTADTSNIRVYIPGIHNENPFDKDGNLKQKYLNNLNVFPKVQWCCYNINSKDMKNIAPLVWVMFENGDMKRPVVISYSVIG